MSNCGTWSQPTLTRKRNNSTSGSRSSARKIPGRRSRTRAESSMDEIEVGGCFSISVVSRMLSLHPQTIRHYEKLGLISPSRTAGNVRLFSIRDVKRLRVIHMYTSKGVNLAGVEIIVELLERMEALEGGPTEPPGP
ncbi:MAG: MerR family transcriptional regulator [Armatimonadetes bacterium]|nr:MerR family transcriptional regulator [Armatimonadota bacterium]